jgi:hypothetical protein
MRRGVRFPQWFLLLVAMLGIYCFAEGWRLEWLLEPAGLGALCHPPSRGAEPGAGASAQAASYGFHLPLSVPAGGCGRDLTAATGLDARSNPRWRNGS